MRIFNSVKKAFKSIKSAFKKETLKNQRTIISKIPAAGKSIFDLMPDDVNISKGVIPYVGSRHRGQKAYVRKIKKAQRRRAYLASLKG